MVAITSSRIGMRWGGILNSRQMRLSRPTGGRADDAILVQACGRGSKSLQPGFRRGPPRKGGRGIRQEIARAISLCPRVSCFTDRASPGYAVGSPGIDDYVTPAVDTGQS